METFNSILDLIGNTPLIELKNIEKKFNLSSHLFAKVEMFNPSGSIKVRIAKFIIEKAFEEKKINQNTIIIEPTSGNTGIGLAIICLLKKLKFIAVMPENMSEERKKLIEIYGGIVILTNKNEGMEGSVKKALELKKEYKNAFIPSQFENLNNPLTHYLTTGKEIYQQMDGNIDVLIAGIGTGGTISGISKYIKERKDIISIGIEPSSSPLINKGYYSKHKIPGIGANFIPKTLLREYVDKVEMVNDENAYKYTKLLIQEEGIFAGISSGAALYIAINEAKKLTNKNIVLILPDSGERYLSMDLS